ncbi:MAG: FGGY family carbohydrate kinase [Planctomycetales bacterium]
MGIYLGIDIGTSGTKTLAIAENGEILASATATYPLSNPRPGWSEQSPEDWWQATISTVKKVLKTGKIKPADVKGIGLSGQMHGSVFLDKSHQVLRPALLWNDQRTVAECQEIEAAAGGRKKLIQMVANPALTGFTAPKILWLRNHEPKHYDKVKQVLLPKDYIRFRLTGEYATEVSDASGTLLLDVRNRRWSSVLLEKLQIDPALAPQGLRIRGSQRQALRGHGEAADCRVSPRRRWRRRSGGRSRRHGIVKSGVISATLGTSGVVFAHSDEVQVDPLGRAHTFCHAVRGKWHVMGVVLSAGGSLQWYRNQFAESEVAAAKKRKVDSYDLLIEEAKPPRPDAKA